MPTWLIGSPFDHHSRQLILLETPMLPVNIIQPIPLLLALQTWRSVFDRLWHYLNDPYHIGSIEVSVTLLPGTRVSSSHKNAPAVSPLKVTAPFELIKYYKPA